MHIGANVRGLWSAAIAIAATSAGGGIRVAQAQDPAQGMELAASGPRFLAAASPRSSDGGAAPHWTDASNAAVFRKLISLELNDVSLAEALSAITERAGLRLTYSAAVVPLDEHTIRVIRIGYTAVTKPVTVLPDQEAALDFALTPQATQLEEVVAIGYGTAQRRELTGAVSSVTAEQVGSAPVTSLDEALLGRAAGVEVVTSSGQPGAGVMVRIRGGNSIAA